MKLSGILAVAMCLAVSGLALADDGRSISQPKNVTATCGVNSVNIAWDAVPGHDVIGYNVYKRISPNGDFDMMNSAPVTGTTYFAQGLSSHTTYDFGVKTVYAGGVLSDMSALATCTTG